MLIPCLRNLAEVVAVYLEEVNDPQRHVTRKRHCRVHGAELYGVVPTLNR